MAQDFAEVTFKSTFIDVAKNTIVRGLVTGKTNRKNRPDEGITSTMWNKFTDREAIAKVMQIRDEIRNNQTDGYSDMAYTERLEYTDVLAQVINLAAKYIELLESESQKTALELFAEVLAERGKK